MLTTKTIKEAIDELAEKFGGQWQSRSERNCALRALGIDLGTADGDRMMRSYLDRRAIFDRKAADIRAAKDAERISPYLEQARELLKGTEPDEYQIEKMASALE